MKNEAKFKVNEMVVVVDENMKVLMMGHIDRIGEYDDYLEDRRYVVRHENSGRITRKNWNEKSLRLPL